MWVGQETYNKTIKFDKIVSNKFVSKEKDLSNPFEYVRVFDLTGSDIKIKGEKPLLNIWKLLQFQI